MRTSALFDKSLAFIGEFAISMQFEMLFLARLFHHANCFGPRQGAVIHWYAKLISLMKTLFHFTTLHRFQRIGKSVLIFGDAVHVNINGST